jgi:beta-phosphoglucomutase family hydrolase
MVGADSEPTQVRSARSGTVGDPEVRMAGRLVRAVIFDMDGVVTDTARVHADAWREVLDETLATLAPRARRFDPDNDYRRYVDGRPRQDGARAFLNAREVALPDGKPDDPPGTATVWQVANAKNARFGELVAQQGVRAFPSTVALMHRLCTAGVPVAVVTASRNAKAVLSAAGVDGLFDALVDGEVAGRLRLAGKPDPATFTEAARMLDVPAPDAAIFEDALAGVSAGRRGGFGLVVGVDRNGHPEALAEAGADVVVADLADLDTQI